MEVISIHFGIPSKDHALAEMAEEKHPDRKKQATEAGSRKKQQAPEEQPEQDTQGRQIGKLKKIQRR